MKRFQLLFIFISIILYSNATDDLQLTFNSGQNTYEIDFSLTDFALQKQIHDGIIYTSIDIDHSVYTNKKGFAELAYVSRAIQLYDNKNVDIIIEEGEYKDFQLEHPLLPSKGVIYRNQNPDEIPFQIDPASITDSWYPAEISTKSNPFILKDIRGVSVQVYPFRYNAAQNILRVYQNMKIILKENSEKPTNPLSKSADVILREMNGVYKSVFMNYGLSKDDLTVGEYGDILVITTARDEDAIQPYIDWKKEKGYNVSKEVVAVATNVVSLVQDAYDNNNNLLYVQLVGGWADIKCNTLGADPMDSQIGCVVGTDEVADISIGRISSNSPADVTIQVNKLITYEKEPDMVDNDWYSSSFGIGSNEGANNGDDGEIDKVHLQNIYDNKLNPFTYNTQYTAYEPGATKQMVFDAINQGVSVINYAGHGDTWSWSTTGFNISDINSLTNDNKLPFIISVACDNGNFHEDNCFGEAWLKKENGGAIMCLAATIFQPWAPPMRGQDYFMDILTGGYDYTAYPGQNGISTSEQRTTIGSIIVNGFALMTSESSSIADWETIKTWILFGDPSLQPRTMAPLELTLSNQDVFLGVDFNTIVTDENSNPIEGAMVCLSDGDNFFSGVTDENGEATIAQSLEPGEAKMVITGFNTETIYNSITVIAPDGPWISYVSNEINDVAGNNNGLADFEENILLTVTLKNASPNHDAIGVQSVLSSTDANITITDNTEDIGNIAASTNITIADAFAFHISDNVPNNHDATFTLTSTDVNDSVWSSQFTITINAPAFAIDSPIVIDTTGNNNGRLDAGEIVDLLFPIHNIGNSDAPDVSVELSILSTDVTLNTTSADLETLMTNEIKNADFSVTVADNVLTGTVVEFTIIVTSGNYTTTETKSLMVGISLEDFETNDFESFDWLFDGNADWFITSNGPYEGIYSSQSMDINDGESTTIKVSLDVTNDGDISFFRKVSSEGGYDFLKFYIDNIEKASWSGDKVWEEFSYAVTPGEHTFKWTYSKDNSMSNGEDCAWLDYIIFPPSTRIQLANPQNLSAVVTYNQADLSWEMNEKATFSHYAIYRSKVGENNFVQIDTSVNKTYTDIVDVSYAYDYYITAFYDDGGESDPSNLITLYLYHVSVDNEEAFETELLGNYPNPFFNNTTIEYSVAENTNVLIEVYNISGQKIAVLVNENKQAGSYKKVWSSTSEDGINVPNGIYFYTFKTNGVTQARKMVVNN